MTSVLTLAPERHIYTNSSSQSLKLAISPDASNIYPDKYPSKTFANANLQSPTLNRSQDNHVKLVGYVTPLNSSMSSTTKPGEKTSLADFKDLKLDKILAASLEEVDSQLKPIIIDGSNVAMNHGNNRIFSCRGISICIDWFLKRGHKNITAFVPRWRTEEATQDTPIQDQELLYQLEQSRHLVFTPSRKLLIFNDDINGNKDNSPDNPHLVRSCKRIVCYDDRYILKLAQENEGIIVSNDNYRDLARESFPFAKIIETRILMYTFVNDKFMPPDDPLGRFGPTLDDFLSFKPSSQKYSKDNLPVCPYGPKCTYGNKCKFLHPEKDMDGKRTFVTEQRLHLANLEMKKYLSREKSVQYKKPLCRTYSLEPSYALTLDKMNSLTIPPEASTFNTTNNYSPTDIAKVNWGYSPTLKNSFHSCNSFPCSNNIPDAQPNVQQDYFRSEQFTGVASPSLSKSQIIQLLQKGHPTTPPYTQSGGQGRFKNNKRGGSQKYYKNTNDQPSFDVNEGCHPHFTNRKCSSLKYPNYKKASGFENNEFEEGLLYPNRDQSSKNNSNFYLQNCLESRDEVWMGNGISINALKSVPEYRYSFGDPLIRNFKNTKSNTKLALTSAQSWPIAPSDMAHCGLDNFNDLFRMNTQLYSNTESQLPIIDTPFPTLPQNILNFLDENPGNYKNSASSDKNVQFSDHIKENTCEHVTSAFSNTSVKSKHFTNLKTPELEKINLYYHLSSLFPAQNVTKVMSENGDVTDVKTLCSILITMS